MLRPCRRLLQPIAATALIALVAFFVLYQHILHGGFYNDDWGNASDYTYASPPRYFTLASELAGLLGGRPLLALLLPAPYAILGTHPESHLALAAGLAAMMTLALYALLRTLGVSLLHAILIALLFLVFPWSDSTRLWPTAAINNIAVILFLFGLLLALRAVAVPGWRGYAWHAVTLLLYVLSVLTYEVAAVAALVAGWLYIGRAPRRRALRLWTIDVVVVVGALIYEWVATAPTRPVPSVSRKLADIHEFAREASWLVARSLNPGATSKTIWDLILLGIIALGIIAVRRRQHDVELRRWLIVGAVGLATIIAAYAVIIGSGLSPFSTGLNNRGNVFAAAGYAVLVYAIIRLAALVILARRPRAATVASAAIAVGLVTWYAVDVRRDGALWDLAAQRQADILRSLRRAVPAPLAGTTIYLYGSPREVAPGIPVFAWDWDFNGAVKLMYRDGTLRAFPVPTGRLYCGRTGIRRPLGIHFNHSDVASYGRIIAFDAATGATLSLNSIVDCQRANQRFGGQSSLPIQTRTGQSSSRGRSRARRASAVMNSAVFDA